MRSILTQVALLVLLKSATADNVPSRRTCAACENVSGGECQRALVEECSVFDHDYCGPCGEARDDRCFQSVLAFLAVCDATPAPTVSPTPGCRVVPATCEVAVLEAILDEAISQTPALTAQFLRMGFHDAGTFDSTLGVGGARGCLLTDPVTGAQPENGGLLTPIEMLNEARDLWRQILLSQGSCIQPSAADVVQFAARFAALRQTRAQDIVDAAPNNFMWGRPDAEECLPDWTLNLPGFEHGVPFNDVAGRVTEAGKEIERKMVEGNGFSPREAVALIGAHSLGMTRTSFGPSLAGPWVHSGADDASDNGPVFGNAFFEFIVHEVATGPSGTRSLDDFDSDTSPPFLLDFGTWFQTPDGLNYLDTDVALAFDLGTAVTDFSVFAQEFANDNIVFLEAFFDSLDKMSFLGTPSSAIPTQPIPCQTPPSSSEEEAFVVPRTGFTAILEADLDAAHKSMKETAILELAANFELDDSARVAILG